MKLHVKGIFRYEFMASEFVIHSRSIPAGIRAAFAVVPE